ncbi:MAG: tRNA (adenosine(37)-N6)-threonylcarbamoyltransferase complex ATPase subunit type 1 TsaE [Alphaproteobacteria bacterium]
MRTTIIALADEAATARFARALAAEAVAGDVIALSGGLGAGKTALARAFVRARAGDPALVVPSPTFTLVQVYELAGGPVWHVDAYRLADADEAVELGLDEAFATAVVLIEWPEHVAGLIPQSALRLALADGPDPDARRLTATAPPLWEQRLDRVLAACDG